MKPRIPSSSGIKSSTNLPPFGGRLGGTRAAVQAELSRTFSRWIFFMPGSLLLLVGCAFVLAPNLVVFLMAGFFLLLGVIGCYVGWRLLLFKNRVHRLLKEFEGRIIIDGSSPSSNPLPKSVAEMLETISDGRKKILFH